LPWLTLIDAHISAREYPQAQKIADELMLRYAKHDVLLQALIDREQRVGAAYGRIEKLFELLLQSKPREAQYVEAYAQWLLTREPADEVRAMAVLDRLPGRDYDNLLKRGALLLAHNRMKLARVTAEKLAQLKADDPRTQRFFAMLYDKDGKWADAEKRWRLLIALPEKPDPADRARALEARQALVSLYRRQNLTVERSRQLYDKLQNKQCDLAETLLFFDLHNQLEGSKILLQSADWPGLTVAMRKQFGHDPEVMQFLIAGLLQHAKLAQAVELLEDLVKVDQDAAEPLLVQVAEMALARAETAVTQRAESLLMREGSTQPPTISVLLRLGDLHLRYGEVAGATAMFRRAAADNPRDTRAMARLATQFRSAGAEEDEAHALREVIERAAEADEIDTAGQRLLTLALAAGQLAGLVRWLDSVLPHHIRRDLIERLRLAAYDTWLRNAPLDHALEELSPQKTAGPPPNAGALGDALASGDLALQVRALRQLSLLGKPVPTAVAIELLHSSNPVLQRDVTLALGASGTAAAAVLLTGLMSHDGPAQDEEVHLAQLVALCQLPATPMAEPLLASAMSRNDLPLASLCLGRVGEGGSVDNLAKQLNSQRGEMSLEPILAVGAILGRAPAIHGDALQKLLDLSPANKCSQTDYAKQSAVLWALAATHQPRARAELLRIATLAQGAPLRRMAVVLLAFAGGPLQISAPPTPVGEADALRDFRARAVRATLWPWLDPERLAPALLAIDAELIEFAVENLVDAASPQRATFCNGFAQWLAVGSKVAVFCAKGR